MKTTTKTYAKKILEVKKRCYVPDNFTGRARWRHDNGKRRKEAAFVNGEKHGEALEWYECGALMRRESYVHGLWRGEEITYYPNGQKAFEKTYGKEKEIWWYPDGKRWYRQD